MSDTTNRTGNAPMSGKGRNQRHKIRYTYLIIGFVAIYMVAQMALFFNRDTTNYIVAKQGEIVEKFSAKGVIIRDEKLVKASSSGVVQYYYPGGKELEKGTLVCTLLDDYYGDILQDKIDQVYEQIQDIDNGEYAEAFQSLDVDVTSTVAAYLRNKNTNNYSSLYTLLGNMSDVVNKRKDMYSLMSSTQVASLLSEQGIYLNEQNSVLSNLYLQEAGTIDYSYDGYEGWTVEQIGADFITAYDSSYSYFDINLQKIDSGTPLYRLVASPIWEMVIYLDEQEAEFFSGETSTSFIYNSTKEMTGTIQSLEKTRDGQYKLVIKMTADVQEVLNDRVASLVFTKNRHTGIKISENCLVQKDYYVVPNSYVMLSGDNAGVLAVSSDGNVSFQSIQVASTIDQDPNDPSAEGKTYFTLPDGVSPGFTIREENSNQTMVLGQSEAVTGVYVVNGGYEQFEIVTILYQSQGYCIVEGIKMYDRVKLN